MFSGFHFFENLNNIPLYIYIYIIPHFVYPFIYWWTPELFPHFGYHVNHTTGETDLQISVQNLLWVLWGTYLKVDLLDYMVILFNFLENRQMVFHRSCPVLHSYQQCISRIFFPHPHQHLLLSIFWTNNGPSGYEVVSHCCFDLCFPNEGHAVSNTIFWGTCRHWLLQSLLFCGSGVEVYLDFKRSLWLECECRVYGDDWGRKGKRKVNSTVQYRDREKMWDSIHKKCGGNMDRTWEIRHDEVWRKMRS